jgi:60 kDa SS-A/Ro ribonucleoprotein
VVTAFTSGRSGISELAISPRQRLDDVLRYVDGLYAGGTDCSLPMIHATERGLEVDAFVVYTDSETWAGRIHPPQALAQYRKKTGIPAKLVVVGMEANPFSIADPNDAGMLDVVGFDTATPAVLADFIRE